MEGTIPVLVFLYLEVDILRMRIEGDDVGLDLSRDALNVGCYRSVLNIDGDQQDEVVVADIHRTDIVYMPDSIVPGDYRFDLSFSSHGRCSHR